MEKKMRRVMIEFRSDSGKTDIFLIAMIDTTHVSMTIWDGISGVTDEELRLGRIYHVGQFRDWKDHELYPAIWDWLREIDDIQGRVFKW